LVRYRNQNIGSPVKWNEQQLMHNVQIASMIIPH